MIDFKNIKQGDWVGVVVSRPCYTNSNQLLVRAGGNEVAYINYAAIVSHTPAPRPALKVGDMVKTPDGGVWEVVFIQDGKHVHFGVVPGTRRFPHPLSEVEQWERV